MTDVMTDAFTEPTVPLLVAAEPMTDWPPQVSLETEWLITNGLGSFAMGTACGANTRRYHGLLNAAARPPVGRHNLLNSVIDSIEVDGEVYELAVNEFHGDEDVEGSGPVIHPHGYRYLHRFERDTAARWHFRVGSLSIVKELRLAWKRNVATLRYSIEPSVASSRTVDTPGAVTLRIRPLVSMRDFHQLDPAIDPARYDVNAAERSVAIHVDDILPLHMQTDRGSFTESPDVWRRFRRRAESDRQQDDNESLFVPGVFEHTFTDVGASTCELTFMFGCESLDDLEKVPDPFITDERRAHLGAIAAHLRDRLPDDRRPELTETMLSMLAVASDDFVVERVVDGEPLASILAGYPWFADWGRDTMIALPGLLLETGRYDDARRTLSAYARNIRRGLVPNRFDDYGGEPHYNTVDASMWFVHAALEYRRITSDDAFWGETLAPACRRIIDSYRNGTDGDIYMDDDGLVSAGNAQTQLTWMDAARDGTVFTPRYGKCVEINALWYRALVGCRELDDDYASIAERVRASFNATFWEVGLEYLIDHVNEHGVDRSLRCNQAIAVSLPVSPLDGDKQRRVMKAVRDRLLTPMGLRTLPRDDHHYHGRYAGSMWERDSAYHRGTVWAWPIGPYVEGYLRAHDFSDQARKHCRQATAALLAELHHHSLGQLHEVFDGDAPHRPSGCPAQAWSVAELLRVVMLTECA